MRYEDIKSLDNHELLKYALAHGVIDENTVRINIMNQRRKYYLSRHKYKIFQDKDGRWKTTLPDPKKKNGRRLVAKKELDVLEETIADFYADLDEQSAESDSRLSPDITLEELYPIWLKSRMLETKNMRTVKRNDQEWKRYYRGTHITKIPMRKLTVNELKDWAHNLINENNFNKTAYYDMTLIIKKCYEYASDEGICDNVWEVAKTKVNLKKLRKTVKKDSETEVYFGDEKAKIIEYAIQQFMERPWNTGVLAIPFIFLTGMRIGEVVALKYEDIQGNEICISTTEVNDYTYDETTMKFKYLGKVVEDHAKSEAGVRKIPYTSGAQKIVDLVKKSSQQYGYYDDGYIFCPASKRLTSNSIDKLLYTYCEKVGIPKKSAHKIRKTYISQIIASGVDLDSVCKISGHTDIKTTFESYCYSLKRKDELCEHFEQIFLNTV